MKVIVMCEESQAVCLAFRDRGHEAYSCDIKACSGGYPEWHFQGDGLQVINGGYLTTQSGEVVFVESWDMLIGHPPCTYLSYAGIAHWGAPGRLEKRLDALDFFGKLWNAPIERICLENPKGCASPTIAKYTQEIQPYYFGDHALKTTWLWLKNLPPLVWTANDDLFSSASSVGKPEPVEIQIRKPSKHFKGGELKKRYFTDTIYTNRQELRSKTFSGIANAMAEQWNF